MVNDIFAHLRFMRSVPTGEVIVIERGTDVLWRLIRERILAH